MSSLRERRAARQIEEAIARDNCSSSHLAWLRRQPNDHWLRRRLGLAYYEQKEYNLPEGAKSDRAA